MKKNKKIIIGVLIVIGIVLIEMLSYRFALVQFNKPESGQGYKTFKNIGEAVTIKTVSNDNLKTYLDINYPKFSDNFEFTKDQSSNKENAYYLYKDDGSYTLLANYSVGNATNYYDKLTTNSDGVIKKNVKLLEKYKIENNLDVVEYLINHYDDKVNIFSSSDSIKMRYLMNSYANSLKEGTIRYIEGDLKGIMIISDDKTSFEVSLINDNKTYYFSFTNGTNNSYFTEESIIEFLNSVSFK